MTGKSPLPAFLFVATACGTSSETSDAGALDSAIGTGVTDGAAPLEGAAQADAENAHDGSNPHDSGTDAAMGTTGGPTLGGCPLFPDDYPYNVDISSVALDPGSAAYIANLTTRAGAIVAEYPGGEYVNVIPATQANVAVETSGAFGFDTTDTFFQNGGAGAVAPIPSGVL